MQSNKLSIKAIALNNTMMNILGDTSKSPWVELTSVLTTLSNKKKIVKLTEDEIDIIIQDLIEIKDNCKEWMVVNDQFDITEIVKDVEDIIHLLEMEGR